MLTWIAPPPDPRLAPDEAHAWLIPIDLPPRRLAEMAATLSPDEEARAARFHFARDRVRYTVARGSLRRILGLYLKRPPTEIAFVYSPYGKPALADDAPLAFNVSHSGDWAVCAVTPGARVGIDIEQIRPDLAGESIAEHFFSPREVAALRGLPPAEQPAAFFRCWTRKEAFVKARGEGLSLPLDRFDVSLRADEPAALLRTLDDPAEAARWSMVALTAPSGYEATVVTEAANSNFTCFDFGANLNQRPVSIPTTSR